MLLEKVPMGSVIQANWRHTRLNTDRMLAKRRPELCSNQYQEVQAVDITI